jgi:hypothetical protein
VSLELLSSSLGLGGAAVSAVIWPALAVRIPDDISGFVLGVIMAGQNAVLVLGPLAVGESSPVPCVCQLWLAGFKLALALPVVSSSCASV